ncbi:MAG TPA: uroporphyrinogen-III synthase [Flavobacterium sp.]|jgi:uroporphyrinogen-III synthase
MSTPIRVLSTKKLLPNQKQFLLNANLSVVESDFIKIKNKAFDLQDINENLIFTSQNAFLSFLKNPQSQSLKDKTVFCVGIKTRQLIEDNGFTVAVYTGYAADLAEIITLVHPKESFTFFSGNLRRDTLPEALKEAGIKFNEIETYETTLTPNIIESNVDGILFFSPSAVESFLKNNKLTTETCFCIGTTTAEALKNITENIIIANQPSIENTIIQCINFYKQT